MQSLSLTINQETNKPATGTVLVQIASAAKFTTTFANYGLTCSCDRGLGPTVIPLQAGILGITLTPPTWGLMHLRG
jgi:hypothetical protein